MNAPDSSATIRQWLENIGMGEYATGFEHHQLTIEMLDVLTDDDLKECGVAALKDRKQILAAIRQQKEAASASSGSESDIQPSAEPDQHRRMGHFELLERIGSGGMGTVYRGWDASLSRQVAIKVLDRALAESDPDFFHDFLREAQSAAGINHPHIVQIYFVGEEGGNYFLVMELLEGQTLDDRLNRGPMDEGKVLEIARQVVEALAATNARRLIHGDIKPQNIFITSTGSVKLLDFGLARKANTSGAKGGAIVGSAYYLSPERAYGQSEDFRSDIYSLGAVMFHAISGMFPFEADDLEQLVRKRLEDEPPHLRSVRPTASSTLDRLLAQMMARDPAERHQSYEALLADISATHRALQSGFNPDQKPRFNLPGAGAPPSMAAPPPVPQANIPVPPIPTGTGQLGGAAPVAHPVEPPRRSRFSFASSRILIISILLHLVFGGVATVLIVQQIQAKRKVTFQAPPGAPNPSTRALEHKVNMTRKQQTMSAPAQAKRITTSGVARISLPEMPSLPSASELTPSKMGGMGGTGMGFGPPGGGGGGGGGTGKGLTMFGMREGGNGLAGTFYDLKQTRDSKPTEMILQPDEQGTAFNINAPVNHSYDQVLSRVVAGAMSEGSLGKYFRGPQSLYITQLFIPAIQADEAPKAFNLGDQVKGRRWAIVYRGKVIAPESGRYRLAGFGDDVLVVRLNGRIVLDASFAPPTKTSQKNTYPHSGLAHGWKTIVGQSFEVTAGASYPMEILIGERPGGEFSGYLLLEKEGIQYQTEGSGAPLLPIFKLAPSSMPAGGPVLPPVAPDTAWSVWKSQPIRSLGF